MPPRTVIVGVGSAVLTDDAVGIEVARQLRRLATPHDRVAVVERQAGGLALMEALVGYDRAVIVDAMVAGGRAGSVYRTHLAALPETRHSTCAHDMTLSAALDLGRVLGLPLPARVDVWGIEPADLDTFGDRLSGEVAAAVPVVVGEIAAMVGLGRMRARDGRTACAERTEPV